MSERDDDFHVGWAPMPAPVAGALRKIVRGVFGVGALVAVLLVGGHGPFAGGAFEYGIEREAVGTIVADPVPALRVARPGRLAGHEVPVVSRWLLVAPGKQGADALVAGLVGKRVRARGTLIWRAGRTMFELTAPPVPLDEAPPPAETPDGRDEASVRLALAGEIVDSKCHWGVMVPGQGTTHRACAVRCLSGGIPPVFVARLDDGASLALLLLGRDGRPLGAEILPLVARPLRVTGQVRRLDDLLVLHADPGDFTDAP